MSTTQGRAKPRILVIDDEEPILFALAEYLGTFGFEVDGAREAEEAEALLAHVRYGAVISDLRLSGVHGTEGLEVVGFVRERCPWARILILTAYGSTEIEAEAYRLGADAFLRKPLPLADVAQAVFGMLGEAA
jgi:DNA-binding response OmpR family regulator